MARLTHGRRLRGRAALLLQLALVALVALDQAAPVVTIDYTGAFIGLIVAAITTIGSFIASQAVTVVVTIAQAAVMIGTAIANFAVAVGSVFAKVWGLLADFYSHALKPFVSWAWHQIDRLEGWLRRTFQPILEFLERVRRQIDAIYDRWFRPVFDTIDAMRRTFQLLAYLHVPWAREIDQALARLESKLLWPLQQVYYRLNEVMGWINRIVTLDGTFQRLTFVRSQWRYVGDTWAALLTRLHRPLTGEQRDEYERAFEVRSVDEHVRETTTYLRTGDAPNAAQIDEHVETVLQDARAA